MALLLAYAGLGCEDRSTRTKLLVFSDPHHFAPSLGTTGAAFESYLSQDRKLLAESDAIVRAMVDVVRAERPDLVLVSGDLTKDGELASHEGFAAYLAQMEDAGAQVFVVPGNHDILNPGAVSYSGTTTTPVANVTPEQFTDIYRDFGYGQAKERDPAGTLGYLAEPRPGLWLLALDTSIYAADPGVSRTGGRIGPETLEWAKAKLAAAKGQGIQVIGMEHHGIVEHFDGQLEIFPQYLIEDYATVGDQLAEAGLHVMLTGHFHANDAVSGPAGPGGVLVDIETGSVATAPCAYRLMTLDGSRLSVSTSRITSIDYDVGGQDFQTYARGQLLEGLDETISALIQAPPYSFSAADAQEIAPLLADGLAGHYAGDEVLPPVVIGQASALMSSPEPNKQLAGQMLISIHSDAQPRDLTLTVDLQTGAVEDPGP